MNSFHFRRPSNLSILTVSGLVAGAFLTPQVLGAEPIAPNTNAPAPSTKPQRPEEKPPTPQDALDFLKLDKVKRICAQPIALKVNNASADVVASQVRLALATAKTPSKIPIEVRRVKSISLTFTSKDSTILKILSSTAQLGAAKLWLFSDHLLLAPAEALTPAEKEAREKGFAMQSGAKASNNHISDSRKRAAYSSFITNELKDIKPTMKNTDALASREERRIRSVGPILGNASFNQLSPNSQAMLQELFSQTQSDAALKPFIPDFSNFSLSSNTPVEFIGGDNNNGGESQLEISMRGADKSDWTFSWGPEGNGAAIRVANPNPTQSPPPAKPTGAPPLDLSAGKS